MKRLSIIVLIILLLPSILWAKTDTFSSLLQNGIDPPRPVDGECRSDLAYWFIGEVAACVVFEFIGLWLVPTLCAEGCSVGAASAFSSAEASGSGVMATRAATQAARRMVMQAAREERVVLRSIGGRTVSMTLGEIQQAETVEIYVQRGQFMRGFVVNGHRFDVAVSQEEYELREAEMNFQAIAETEELQREQLIAEADENTARIVRRVQIEREMQDRGRTNYNPHAFREESEIETPLTREKVTSEIKFRTRGISDADIERIVEAKMGWEAPEGPSWFVDGDLRWFCIQVCRETGRVEVFQCLAEEELKIHQYMEYYRIIRTEGLTRYHLLR